MDMRLLRTFVVTARELHFRRAAERLFLAQPTVTQHIRLLEQELRVQVFERSGRRVRLTAAGERFLEYARRTLAVFDQGVQELSGWRQGYRERLVVAVSPLVARYALPRIMKRFTDRHPYVEVVVQIHLSPQISVEVTEGRAHVGLGRIPVISRDLDSFAWHSDPVLLVVPHDGQDLDAPPPDWRDALTQNRLLTHNHPGYWDDLLLSLHNQGLPVRTMEVGLVDVTKRFIEEGLGISFLPHSTVWRELVEGRLLEVPTPGLELPVASTYVMWRTDQNAGASAAFRSALREH